MKILTLLIAFIFFTSCSNQIAADKLSDEVLRPTPTINNSNSANPNSFPKTIDESETVDKKRLEELATQNEKFAETPEEFKNVDWENFKFGKIRLKNGEFEELDKEHAGSTTYSLLSVYYVDLAGDSKKESVVSLGELSCGGSCGGWSETIYFYSSLNGKPKLLDKIITGCRSCGCSIKSFKVQDKKIILEQFGNCIEKTDPDYKNSSCKFCIKDLTNSTYSFNNNSELVRESINVTETQVFNVMNYISEVSINE